MSKYWAKMTPKFIRQLNQWLLENHPLVWKTQVHFVTFFGLVAALILFLLGLIIPLTPDEINIPPVNPYIIHKESTLFILLIVPVFLFWGYEQYQKGMVGLSIMQSLIIMLCYSLGASVLLNLTVPAYRFGEVCKTSKMMDPDTITQMKDNGYYAYGFMMNNEDSLINSPSYELNITDREKEFRDMIKEEDLLLKDSRYNMDAVLNSFIPNDTLEKYEYKENYLSSSVYNVNHFFRLLRIRDKDKKLTNDEKFVTDIQLSKLAHLLNLDSTFDTRISFENYCIFRNRNPDLLDPLEIQIFKNKFLPSHLKEDVVNVDSFSHYILEYDFIREIVGILDRYGATESQAFIQEKAYLLRRFGILDINKPKSWINSPETLRDSIKVIKFPKERKLLYSIFEYVLNKLAFNSQRPLEGYFRESNNRIIKCYADLELRDTLTFLRTKGFTFDRLRINYYKYYLESGLKDTIYDLTKQYSLIDTFYDSRSLAVDLIYRDRLEDFTRSVIHSKQYLKEWIIVRHWELMLSYIICIAILFYLIPLLSVKWFLIAFFLNGAIVYSINLHEEIKSDLHGHAETFMHYLMDQGEGLSFFCLTSMYFLIIATTYFKKGRNTNLYNFSVASITVIICYAPVHAFDDKIFFIEYGAPAFEDWTFYGILLLGLISCLIIGFIHGKPKVE